MAERSDRVDGTMGSLTGTLDPIQAELERALSSVANGYESVKQIRLVEDAVSAAIGSRDVDQLFRVYRATTPDPFRKPGEKEGAFGVNTAAEIALRGLVPTPSEREYEELAQLSYGRQPVMEPGAAGIPRERELYKTLGIQGYVAEDEEFGHQQLTGRGYSALRIWERDFPDLTEAELARRPLIRELQARRLGSVTLENPAQ